MSESPPDSAATVKRLSGGWIKLHRDILESREFATLPADLWRLVIELRILIDYRDGSERLPASDDIAFNLRRSNEEISTGLAELEKRGFLIRDGESLAIPHYLEEQPPDSVNERVARHRKAKMKREGNEPVTKSYLEREENRIEKETNNTAALPEVLNTPEFLKAWDQWFAYRKENKLKAWKPMTIAAALKELEEMGESGAIAAINCSIAKGWQGLFEPRATATKPTEKKSKYAGAF